MNTLQIINGVGTIHIFMTRANGSDKYIGKLANLHFRLVATSPVRPVTNSPRHLFASW